MKCFFLKKKRIDEKKENNKFFLLFVKKNYPNAVELNWTWGKQKDHISETCIERFMILAKPKFPTK